jgi:hypothetical protein
MGEKIFERILAEEILIKTALKSEVDYAIYIKEDNSLAIKKMPEKYKAYLYIKNINTDRIEEPKDEKIKDVFEKVNDIINPSSMSGIKVHKHKITYEVYVHDDFVDEVAEIVYQVSGKKYLLHDKSQAWAIAFQYEKRFKAKYTQYSKYAFAYVNADRRYEPGINVIIPQPSEKFINILQKIIKETREEEIEDEEIKKLRERLRELQGLT